MSLRERTLRFSKSATEAILSLNKQKLRLLHFVRNDDYKKQMEYGVCNISVVPCRAQPSDKSEMVTQLLFGEMFEIIERQKKWIKIKNKHDGYESWIDTNQYISITAKEYENTTIESLSVVSDLVGIVVENETDNTMPVLLGSFVNNIDENGKFLLGNQTFSAEFQCHKIPEQPEKTKIAEIASLYKNAPYLWGGRSPFGIDCSGFVQNVFRFAGIQLPRDAYQQAETGTTLSFIEEAELGDLAFFDNEEGKIIHVGIMLSADKIIHAHGKVRIGKIDHEGIFNAEQNKYSHHLRILKRVE